MLSPISESSVILIPSVRRVWQAIGILTGGTLVDRKSVFQAHIAPCTGDSTSASALYW